MNRAFVPRGFWLVVAGACSTEYDSFHVGAGVGATASGSGAAGVTTGPSGSGAADPTGGRGGAGTGGQGPSGGQGGMLAAGGCGGVDPAVLGCSDGTRELFVDPVMFPSIAGCSGTWQLGGTQTSVSDAPQCNLGAGNPGCVADGAGCSVADLCALGWHVCEGKDDVAAKSSIGCDPIPRGVDGLWLTRQMVDGGEGCSGAVDAHFAGCGNIGRDLSGYGTTCDPLNAVIGGSHGCPSPWVCGPTAAEDPFVVHKTGPELGGVLCCID